MKLQSNQFYIISFVNSKIEERDDIIVHEKINRKYIMKFFIRGALFSKKLTLNIH